MAEFDPLEQPTWFSSTYYNNLLYKLTHTHKSSWLSSQLSVRPCGSQHCQIIQLYSSMAGMPGWSQLVERWLARNVTPYTYISERLARKEASYRPIVKSPLFLATLFTPFIFPSLIFLRQSRHSDVLIQQEIKSNKIGFRHWRSSAAHKKSYFSPICRVYRIK